MDDRARPLHVSLVSIPDAMASTLSGLYETLNAFDLLATFDDSLPDRAPFAAEVVAETRAPTSTASRLVVGAHRSIDEVEHTDIVIVPSVMVAGGHWRTGRYPAVVDWLREMHARGAMLCSACSGVLLLAETGLLDGLDATIHWAYAPTFRDNFPDVRLRLEKVLLAAGEREQFVMSGASASWHDLVLYLVARFVGAAAAQAVAKFLLLQWHVDGQAPYVVFQAPAGHGDAAILDAQRWLEAHFAEASPVDAMMRRSGLAERSFKRRFTKATGHAPIAYVQRLRIEQAKRQLERTEAPIDEIGWSVGYEDPAFFRRLFKRLTGITPGAYRRKFRIPDFARRAPAAGPLTRPASPAAGSP